ncbi:MAG: hypothetical protein IJL54_08770 [Prevotella sp.]|nr:hypothetical protein [Prevotella sp.]
MRRIYSLFAALLLLAVGSVNVWADSWSVNFTGLVSNDTEIVISSTDVVNIGGTNLGTISYGGTAVDSKFVIQTGTKWLMRSGGLYQFNGGARAFGLQDCKAGQIITIAASADPSVSTNATLKSSGNGTWVYTVTADGGVKFTPARYLWFYSINVEDPAAGSVSYTVKYVDQNGNSIKGDASYDEVPGTEVVISDVDKANVVVDGVTYLYVSDDSEGKTVAEDGSTVVTVVFRVANNYSYTVNEVCGENVVNSTEGIGLESTSVKVPYHQYNLIDGVLYEKANTGNEYNHSFVLSQDAQVENLTYNATTINNVVYFSEAENIEGATANNGSNANIRCSNSYGAYFENDVTITTLPAGTYKVAMQIWGNAGTTFTINAGETAVLEATTVGYRDAKISEPFTLTEETAITIPAAGSNGKVIDWIYIQKVPATYNYSVVTNLGTTIAEGSVSEGESVTFAYPEYILQDGTLYRTSLRNATGNGFYKYTLTPAQDGEELVIEYAPAIENVVYFSEAENIEGATANDRNNTDIRCSNALGAIFPEDVTIATLPAGAYKFGVQVWGNPGTTFEIKAGESTIMEAATVGYLNVYTKDIVLTEEAEIVIAAAGSNGKVIDWVYIQRVGDVPSYDINISSVGYATFYDSKYSFEVPAGVTAKTYTYESPVLNESVVYAEGDVIPAGEAVVLEGAAGTYTFNYAVATAEKDADNVLKGTDEATEITSENKLYILSNGAHGVGFYFQNEDGTSITNGAHKAYLEVAGDVETKSFYLFDEASVTAIQGVVAAEAANGKVFDLQGRNVKNPVKGLYIVNGKKVVIK